MEHVSRENMTEDDYTRPPDGIRPTFPFSIVESDSTFRGIRLARAETRIKAHTCAWNIRYVLAYVSSGSFRLLPRVRRPCSAREFVNIQWRRSSGRFTTPLRFYEFVKMKRLRVNSNPSFLPCHRRARTFSFNRVGRLPQTGHTVIEKCLKSASYRHWICFLSLLLENAMQSNVTVYCLQDQIVTRAAPSLPLSVL